ncbi:MAG: bifunctional DNA primase/polymerase [Candidatus Bathyarchaeia archaeon]|jgi:hypothetical protein
MNEQQARLIFRLKEKELSLKRFLKVGEDKAAFEFEFPKHLYGPEAFETYPRWGICGCDFLVLIDSDKQEMYDLLSQVLPETFEVTSPRRGLGHKYFVVCGEQVPNRHLHIPGDKEGAGEIRADNQYLVAPGTTIKYKDLKTGEQKTGEYTITKDVPIARMEYADFMAAIIPFLGEHGDDQKITNEEIQVGVPSGTRHAKAISYAYHMIANEGLGEALTLDALIRWDKKNQPPINDIEYFKRAIRAAIKIEAQHTKKPNETLDQTKERLRQGRELRKVAETPTEEPRESQADRLIRMCEESNVELFIDQHNTPYVRIKIPCATCATYAPPTSQTALKIQNIEREKGDREVGRPQIAQVAQFKLVNYAIDSSFFRQWLAKLMWDQEGKAPASEAIVSAKTVLKGKAQSEGKRYTLFNRVAPTEDGIWLDMADDNWRAIHVTVDGWKIVNDPPILFKRYSHQLPYPEPAAEGDVWQLLSLLNISETDEATKLIVVTSFISYFIPLIAHPVIVVSGPQGSAKTWFLKLAKMIVDPSSVELLIIGRDERELAQQLDHHWLTPFDNISYLPDWASDMVCRAITGLGISVRKLYTDDEDVILSFKHCAMLNGINVAAHKGDLLNRAILVVLEPILTEKRRTEKELATAFDVLKSYIFAGCLNVLSKALALYPTIELKGYERLADFDQYGCAIAMALGKTQKEFVDAYAQKVEQQNEETLNADNVALAFLKYCQTEVKGQNLATMTDIEKDCVQLSPTELYVKVSLYAQTSGIDVKTKGWPRSPGALTRRLNLVSVALKSIGCEITSYEGTPRQIKINVENLKTKPKPPESTPKKPEETLDTIRLKATYDFIKQKHRETGMPLELKAIEDQESVQQLIRESKVFFTQEGYIAPVEGS